MTRARPLAPLLLLLLLLGATLPAATAELLVLPLTRQRAGSRSRPPPLDPPAPAASAAQRRGKKLLKADPARPPAELRLNRPEFESYLSTTVHLGTPAKAFELVVDTGSSATYVPCRDCAHCGKHLHGRRFDPGASSTAKPVRCKTRRDCRCGSLQCQCAGGRCKYAIRYKEGSTSRGRVLTDRIMLGAADANGSTSSSSSSSPSSSPPPPLAGKVRFGCATHEAGLIFSQKADGLLGLSKARVSVLNQLASAGKVPGANVFSVCASPTGGFLAIGQSPSQEGKGEQGGAPFPFCDAGAVRVPYMYNTRIKRRHLYAVAVKSIAVGGAMVGGQGPPHLGPIAAVVDTGSTLSYLPEGIHAAFVSLMDAARPPSAARVPRQQLSHGGDVCYAVGKETRLRDFPNVSLNFSPSAGDASANASALVLGPQAYLYQQTGRLRQKMYCLLFHPSKQSEALLGSVMLENLLLVFNNDKHFLSFRPCRCSQWQASE